MPAEVRTPGLPDNVLSRISVGNQVAVPGEKVTFHHKESGMKIVLPSDRKYNSGTFNDGLLGERIIGVFPREAPTEWNAVKMTFRFGNSSGDITIYVLPAAEPGDFSNAHADAEVLRKLLHLDDKVTVGNSTQYAGHPAAQIERRAEYGEMGTFQRNTMVFHESHRFGYVISTAYLTEQTDGSEFMKEMADWFGSNVDVELPD